MEIRVCSLVRVMQDAYHQPYLSCIYGDPDGGISENRPQFGPKVTEGIGPQIPNPKLQKMADINRSDPGETV